MRQQHRERTTSGPTEGAPGRGPREGEQEAPREAPAPAPAAQQGQRHPCPWGCRLPFGGFAQRRTLDGHLIDLHGGKLPTRKDLDAQAERLAANVGAPPPAPQG